LIEAGKDFGWGGEVSADAEGEEVGGVAGAGEDLAGDLEGAVADLDEDVGFEELGYQSGYWSLSAALVAERGTTYSCRTERRQTVERIGRRRWGGYDSLPQFSD
jgi:hypothetical protein